MSAPTPPMSRPRLRLRAWWTDVLQFVVLTVMVELALHEAVVRAPIDVSDTVRSLLDAVGLAVIIGPLLGWTLYRRHVDARLSQVQTTTFRVPGSPHHRVRIAVHASLLVFGALVGGALWGHLKAEDARRAEGELSTLVSRQRLHAERMMRFASAADSEPAEIGQLTNELASLLEDARRVDVLADRLSHGTTATARSAWSVLARNRADRDSLRVSVEAFTLLTFPAERARVADTIQQRADALRAHTEVVLDLLQRHQAESVQQGIRAAWVMAAFLFAMLLGIALVVIEPAVRLLRRQHVAVTTRSVEFERLAQVAQRTAQQLADAQSMARLGSWSFDSATRHLQWSAELFQLFGRDSTQWTPTPELVVDDQYHPDEVPVLLAALQHTQETGEPYSLLMRTAERNPAVRWVRAEGRVQRRADGTRVGLMGTVMDVTDAIEREEALRQAQQYAEGANRSKSEFLANMSHEIRTPLTAILGHTDLLREEAVRSAAPRDQVQGLETIQRAGEHLLTVLNDILDISRIEAGRLEIEPVACDLPALLLDVESLMRARAAAKGLTLETRLRNTVPSRVFADPTRVRQILMNLVGNAVKFTAYGRVTIEAGVERAEGQEWLTITVDDTGPGMTEQQESLLFQPFMQADGSVTRRHGGTGLGLAICRRLATLMGGHVRLVHTAPGRGSRFELRLVLQPIASAACVDQLDSTRLELADAAALGAQRPAVLALRGRILLAEDGEDNQRLIALLLRTAGAEVTVAPNGRQALEALEWASAAGAPFDLLVTDMQMPEMDGYTLAATLRARGETMPIIALTAHAMAEDRARCLDAGCDDYASKPIDRAALIATCAHWLREEEDLFPQVLYSEMSREPELAALVARFASALPDRVATIDVALREGRVDKAVQAAHQLKGAAGSYGYPAVGDLARELEQQLLRESPDTCGPTMDRLQHFARAAQRGAQGMTLE
ncbi:MAG TPA: hybrid sensor histidine kinase/response regulator [Gemmatimonas aurantiaca]|nr:hybrid sensor histidine kinase/response regulator [Gemmatimonas aurantiaca]